MTVFFFSHINKLFAAPLNIPLIKLVLTKHVNSFTQSSLWFCFVFFKTG